VDQPSLSAAQARMARAALQLTMREVAERAGTSANTLCKLEAGRHKRLPPEIAAAIRRAYEESGVRFSAHGIAEVRPVGFKLGPGL
jgi:transcriptional regulator with XRE-family HTH domain